MQAGLNRIVFLLCALSVLAALASCGAALVGSSDFPSTASEPAPAPAPVVEAPAPVIPPAPPPRIEKGGGGPASPQPGASPDQVVWNYWIDTQKEGIVPSLKTGKLALNADHWFRFRLSKLNLQRIYPGIGASGVTSDLDATVQAAIADQTVNELFLDVLIHPADETLVRIDASARQQTLKIDLEKVRAASPLPDPLPAIGSQQLRGALSDALLTQFAFKFRLTKRGVHQVAITIVDSASGFPLQTMIAELEGGANLPESVSLSATGQSGLGGGGVPFDLALHLYELESRFNGESVTTLQAELRSRDKATGKVTYFHWKTRTTLNELKQLANTFKNSADSAASGEDLLRKGYKLGRQIFNPLSESSATATTGAELNLKNARAARQAIVAAADYPDDQLPPSMLVRIVTKADTNTAYTSALLPIGALGVSVDTPEEAVFLGERFALALILSGQAMGLPQPCPSKWYVAFPSPAGEKSGALFDMRKALEPAIAAWPNPSEIARQSPSLSQLAAWLASSTSVASAEPYVFAFMGHQGGGKLFLGDTGGVDAGDIERYFHKSSVAILNACDSALDDISAGRPVGKLASRNVGATVATTSSISGYLAAAYMNCLGQVLQGTRSLTIGQAHALTTQCLWSAESSARWGLSYDFNGIALKYILVGNPFQPICAPVKKPEA